mgnify:CR=1 FL=1
MEFVDEAVQSETFAARLMAGLEGSVYENFDVHDVEVALGDGRDVAISVIDLPLGTEEALAHVIDQYLGECPAVPQGVVALLELSSVPTAVSLCRLLTHMVRLRYPDSHLVFILRNDLPDCAPARLTFWCRRGER